MKKLLVLLFSFIPLFASPIKAETVLYCQSELATGITKSSGTWKAANFKKKRFTIKFNNDYTRLEGISFDIMDCKAPYTNKKNIIFCVQSNYNHSTLRYNTKTRRFVHYFNPTEGYVVTSKTDTDIIFAGTCKAF